MTDGDPRGLAALTTAIRDIGSVYASNGDRMMYSAAAAAILGERGVFWPDGTDEYREAIRQHQAELEVRRKIREVGRNYIRWTQGLEGSGEVSWEDLRAALDPSGGHLGVEETIAQAQRMLAARDAEIERLRAALARFVSAWDVWIAPQPGDWERSDWEKPEHELDAAIKQVRAALAPEEPS